MPPSVIRLDYLWEAIDVPKTEGLKPQSAISSAVLICAPHSTICGAWSRRSKPVSLVFTSRPTD